MGFFSERSKAKGNRRDSETAYNRAPPPPSYYGPHFQRAPLQDEILQQRAHQIVPRSHIYGRAHSFSDPIQQHTYSDPYESRPKEWTDRMKAEYKQYKVLENTSMKSSQRLVTIGGAVNLKEDITWSQGQTLKAGIEAAGHVRTHKNRIVQARSGFDQKHPQAYQNHGAMDNHEDKISEHRGRAAHFRGEGTKIGMKYRAWENKSYLIGDRPRRA